ncbi:MAG TPA: TetR/AcrR family transcriptional regulator [Anaerolineaceae bacterium]|nr:TetR/AcrR family transcriptional regulator [Anaerolineaceae bacterium]
MARRLNTQTRQHILDTARQLFTERGFDNTSLKDIALAAGISPGTLFYHYSSKSNLIFDVTDQYFNQLTHRLVEWVGEANSVEALQGAISTPNQILRYVFNAIVNDTLRGKLHHYLIEQAVSCDPAMRTRFLQKYQEWRQMIEEGVTPFVPNPDERRLLAHIIASVLDGLVIQSILGAPDLPVDAVADYLADTAVRGQMSEAGSPYQ